MKNSSAGFRFSLAAAMLVWAWLAGQPANAQPMCDADPAASFTGLDLIEETGRDGFALIPLSNWAPLFGFSMEAGEADVGEGNRWLERLHFSITADRTESRDWDRFYFPRMNDILQIGIFRTFPDDDDEVDLDEADIPTEAVQGRAGTSKAGVSLVFYPDGTLVQTGESILVGGGTTTDLDFVLDLFDFEFNTGAPEFANNYIVAFRTSKNWRNATSLSFILWEDNEMGKPITGDDPIDSECAPDPCIDSYDPDPCDEEFNPLAPDSAYSSSFTAWDYTGGPNTNAASSPLNSNAWAHPRSMYTPLSEYRRPRFDVAGSAFDIVTGEFLEIRRLMPTDQWSQLIALNVHSTDTPVGLGEDNFTILQSFAQVVGAPALKEVNVILTDIGADPNAPAGNGGFNPTQGLETMTDQYDSTSPTNEKESIRRDFGFNGIWVFHDTNQNGFFDPPVQLEGGGVSYDGGDYPMVPEGLLEGFPLPGESPDDRTPGLPVWEYIPNPPGGGDPWWKIRLRFSAIGSRRNLTTEDIPLEETGLVEPVPDQIGPPPGSSETNDFFIVVRPDSGYFDISGLPGDGVGISMGADFRAFIEPRRFNPNTGHLDGGVYINSHIVPDSDISEGVYFSDSWQDDPLWGVTEPWWTERTLNETNSKPVRIGAEIHDLVLNYETNNLYATITDTNYGSEMYYGGGIFTTDPDFFPNFSRWLDPFGLRAAMFQDVHAPGVQAWRTFFNGPPASDDHVFNVFQYPYETVPFLQLDDDLPPFGPRSSFFPSPPPQPTLPDFSTWPKLLQPGEYPRESQWPIAQRKARYLKQHVEVQGSPTAMLGVNVVGADDLFVNQFTQIKLKQMTVAFWGNNFTPSDLLALDPNGTSSTSGVVLAEDTSGDGVFGGSYFVQNPLTSDAPVQLTGMAWRTAPELVDVTGDGVADDMNGDGVVNDTDKAWVLRLRPTQPWPVPVIDASGGHFPVPEEPTGGVGGIAPAALTSLDGTTTSLADGSEVEGVSEKRVVDAGTSYWAKTPTTVQTTESATRTKALGPAGHAGDDLFVVVRTNDTLRRFEQFRVVVPATLPERIGTEFNAGIEMVPQTPISRNIYTKAQPEDGAVQAYYGPLLPTYKPDQPWLSYDTGYDMLEANIGVKLNDLTGTGQTIAKNSGNVAVLGLDLSTNRTTAVGTVASGSTGVGSAAAFTVNGAGWTPGAFTGFFLVDKNYQSFRITGNTNNKLSLEASANAAGTPATGVWRVVKDPSFLEQLIIEFYDVDNDGDFNILDDLMPFNINPDLSGIKLYRDNDNDPSNENGVFDPTDLPVVLDYPPFQIGQAGEPDIQVMMVFSTPGTDNIPTAIQNQTRHRQWIPDTFGTVPSDPEIGSDLFVVIETSDGIEIGDNFRVGLVSWGPNTPTEPDPDTFPPPPASRVGEFDVFSEFPWGARALGFITFFTDEPYYKQYPEVDNSGFGWVRSTANKNVQTRTITAVEDVVSGDELAITSVAPTQLPKTIGAGGLTLSINGQNFGTAPIASLDGLALTIVSSTDVLIIATIPGGTTIDTDNNNVVTLRVTDSNNGDFDIYNQFTIGSGSGGNAPTISNINPSSGTQNAFPVTITGTNFDDPKVFFGQTIMPINSWTSTTIVVGFPVGGLPVTGPLDVTVQNQSTGLFASLPDGFNYINNPGGGGGGGGFQGGGGLPTCFIATAAYGSPLAGKLDTFREFRDAVLLKTAVGAAMVDFYYTVSPPVADYVAAHPAVAACVRLVLTPVAWSLESPVLALMSVLLIVAGAWTARRRWNNARA